MEENPEPNEGWLQYFQRKGKFSDCILLAWSEIEFHIDQVVAREFGLFIEDKKAKILLEMNFQRKIVFLKENGVITKEEFDVIKKFQEYRNKIFHGKEPFFFNLSDKEKDEIMDNAVEAAQLALAIGFRVPIYQKQP